MIQNGDMEAVQQLIARLGKEISQLVKAAIEISYFSRGAWSYEQVLRWSQSEKDIAVDFINERLKIAAKSPYPVY